MERINVTGVAITFKQSPSRFICGIRTGEARTAQLAKGVIVISQFAKSGQ